MKKLLLLFVLFTFSCESEPTDVDVLISGGMIHDGTGMNGYIGNVAINNDTIFYVGKKNNFIAKKTIDLELDDLCNSCFLNDIDAMKHETMTTRIFRS